MKDIANKGNTNVKPADSAATRSAIFRLEDYIKSIPGNGIEESGIKHVHHFADNTYAREMIVPPDVFITGLVHKTEHISIFLEGTMIVTNGLGQSVEIKAPMVEIGRPGIKRAGYTVDQVRWITIHSTNETDIDALEELLLTNDPEEAQVIIDQEDYLLTSIPDELLIKLEALEVHEKEVDGVEIRPSKRHGLGLFVTKPFSAGSKVAPAIIDGNLMSFSRYMNHSADPNATHEWVDGDAHIIALRDLDNEEVTIDYRTTIVQGMVD